jgi:23S rRNA (cytosine1962-C5)-methyltransferase
VNPHAPRSPFPVLRLRKPLRSAIESGHPWLYRDAVSGTVPAPGMVVRVEDDKGFVATGWAEAGPIAVRVLSTKSVPIDAAFLSARLRSAASLRGRVVPPETNAYRLVHGEGDGLPGVVVDIYDTFAVLKFDGEAAPMHTEPLLDAIVDAMPALRGVLVRRGRGEQKRITVGRGHAPPELVHVKEHGMKLRADLHHGQKTGLFLDHRESRRRVRELAKGARVLNLYGYTGGFSIAAGLGGAAEVDTVDVAPAALELAKLGFSDNQIDAPHRTHAQDVPQFLEDARARRATWDFIVADPPSFAPNEASLPAAIKSYRALHRACLRALPPGGFYLAASCSSHIDRELFDRTLREASEKVGPVQVLERWGAPGDHPRLAPFPEGDYLKIILARRLA